MHVCPIGNPSTKVNTVKLVRDGSSTFPEVNIRVVTMFRYKHAGTAN